MKLYCKLLFILLRIDEDHFLTYFIGLHGVEPEPRKKKIKNGKRHEYTTPIGWLFDEVSKFMGKFFTYERVPESI